MKNKNVEVRQSKIHSAGQGVFAVKIIKKGTHILEYTGNKLTRKQSDEADPTYIFELNSRYSIDGKSTARYVNHSCEPNCEAEIIKGRIWIIALRDIHPGEELCYNYGYEYSEAKDYPCACGTPPCIGYIISEDERFKIKRYKKKKSVAKKQKKLVAAY